MFVVIIRQAAVDYEEMDLFCMSLDQVGREDRIAIALLQRQVESCRFAHGQRFGRTHGGAKRLSESGTPIGHLPGRILTT